MRLILVRMSFWGKCIAYKQEVYVTGTQTEIDGGFFAFFFFTDVELALNELHIFRWTGRVFLGTFRGIVTTDNLKNI